MAARSKAALPAPAAATAVPASPVSSPVPSAGVTPKPWTEKSLGQKMQASSHLGLDVLQQVLSAPVDLTNMKLLGLQIHAAVSVISQAIRIEAEQLREPNPRLEAEKNRLLAEMTARAFGDGADRKNPR